MAHRELNLALASNHRAGFSPIAGPISDADMVHAIDSEVHRTEQSHHIECCMSTGPMVSDPGIITSLAIAREVSPNIQVTHENTLPMAATLLCNAFVHQRCGLFPTSRWAAGAHSGD